jgi:hypothetical protein
LVRLALRGRHQAGKWTKPPYQTTDVLAENDNEATWNRLTAVWQAVQDPKFDGIGFMLKDLKKLAVLDLDDVRDPMTGALVPWAEQTVKDANSYTEITSSYCGLRIIGLAPADWSIHQGSTKHPSGEGEVHVGTDTGRYITITGHQLPGTSGELRDISHIVQRLAKPPHPHRGGGPPPPGHGTVIDLDTLDADIAELIEHGTENGESPEHRGQKFYKVVRRLHEAGHNFLDALSTLEAHPNGVQDKYISEDRLKSHLWKLWQRLDAGETGDEFETIAWGVSDHPGIRGNSGEIFGLPGPLLGRWIGADEIPFSLPVCESGWMRKGIEVRLGAGGRKRLEAIVGSGSSAEKHVWRARIVPLRLAFVYPCLRSGLPHCSPPPRRQGRWSSLPISLNEARQPSSAISRDPIGASPCSSVPEHTAQSNIRP